MAQTNFEIKKVLNNNVVFSENELGEDIIVTGLGVGFQKKRGDHVDPSKVERVFALKQDSGSDRLWELLKEIPMDYFYLADQVKKMAEEALGAELNQNIYITLCDHMFYAVERCRQGMLFQNQLMWELKRFYPKEYQVSLAAIELINRELNIKLPQDEASFIALHIINAEFNGKEIQSVIDMTKLISGICNIVQYEFKLHFDEDSIAYTRFLLHLKFFSQRLVMKEKEIEEADFLYNQVRENMGRAFACAQKIAAFIKSSCDYEISKSEQVYLTIHIERLLKENGAH